MNAIDTKQATLFVVVFFVIALLINSTQGFGTTRRTAFIPTSPAPPPQQSSQNLLAAEAAAETARAAQAAKDAEAKAAAEHAKFLARYLNGTLSREPGSQAVAIVVANDKANAGSALTSALARHFQNSSVQIFTSFFTPDFISDGLFNDVLSGSRDLFRKLELAKSVDTLVLAQEDIEYSQSPALENLITATIRLDVHVLPVSGQDDGMTWTFTAYGPGFNKDVARKAAEERLIKQISTDTKMSLH